MNSKRKLVPCIRWPIFFAIATLLLCALAASEKIPFGPPLSFANVASQLEPADLVPDKTTALVLCGGTLALLHSSMRQRFRLTALACGMFLPLMLIISETHSAKGALMYPILAFSGPLITLEAIFVETDGEFYAEGMPVLAVLGWWLIFFAPALSISPKSLSLKLSSPRYHPLRIASMAFSSISPLWWVARVSNQAT